LKKTIINLSICISSFYIKNDPFFPLGEVELSTTTTTKAPEPIFYDRIVTSSEKVTLINDFMNCNFSNYTKTYTSPTARFFVFQLPNPGKNEKLLKQFEVLTFAVL
jgi:hypothetical protein